VCADWRGPLGDDYYGEGMERPVGMRPVGMRPVGMRPVGMRPVGMRPVGMRPVGMRPVGMRPVGMRPVGMRPVGMRPVGMRPVGMRPVGMRDDGSDEDAGAGCYLDPDEWAADIAMLFCEYSAVLRLGANLVFGLDELPFPSPPVLGVPRYLPGPVLVDEEDDTAGRAVTTAAAATLARVAKRTGTQLSYRRLKPRSHELTIQIAVRNRLVRTIVEHPEVAWALKQDIASALAFRADEGFLHGKPDERAPRGIASMKDTIEHALGGANPLKTARAIISQLRRSGTRFICPGWILHPKTLDELSDRVRKEAAKDDAGQLLTYDGADGGTLLGYPYIVSAASEDGIATPSERMFFGSDWTEAWIGAEEPLVMVDVAPDIRLESDETLIRAVTQHDFALRAPEAFVHTGAKGAQKAPAASRGAKAAKA
jgi:HK97 family phage major capsid protein